MGKDDKLIEIEERAGKGRHFMGRGGKITA